MEPLKHPQLQQYLERAKIKVVEPSCVIPCDDVEGARLAASKIAGLSCQHTLQHVAVSNMRTHNHNHLSSRQNFQVQEALKRRQALGGKDKTSIYRSQEARVAKPESEIGSEMRLPDGHLTTGAHF